MVVHLPLASWAPKILLTYNTYINKWIKYYLNDNISDSYQATYKSGMSFLVQIFHEQSQLWSHYSCNYSHRK